MTFASGGRKALSPERSRRAFTLIELLIVISIIGILATLIMVNLNSARKKARDVKRKADIASVQTALSMYADETGGFPALNCTSSEMTSNVCVFSDDSFNPVAQYLSSSAQDPLYDGLNGKYHYTYKGDDSSYTICANTMEIPDAKTGSTQYCKSEN